VIVNKFLVEVAFCPGYANANQDQPGSQKGNNKTLVGFFRSDKTDIIAGSDNIDDALPFSEPFYLII